MLTRITTVVLELLFAACGASPKPSAAPTNTQPTAAPPTTGSTISDVSACGPRDGRVAVRRAQFFHCADMRNGLSGYRVYVVDSGAARGKRVIERYSEVDGFGAGDLGERFVGRVVLAPVTIPEHGWPNSCAGIAFDGRISDIVEAGMACN
jgi:hypothetical protein